MAYCVSQTTVSKEANAALFSFLDDMSVKTGALYNAAIFRLRQRVTMVGKSTLSANEKEVLAEIERTISIQRCGMPKRFMSYVFLEKLMRSNANPDFFSGLPMQSAQQVLKLAVRSMKSWVEASKAYHADPDAFTGRPKMPGYRRGGRSTVVFTNQDCRIRNSVLKFPLTREALRVYVPEGASLKEVQVKPFYGRYKVICIFEANARQEAATGGNTAAIDLGVSNIASIVVNDESISPVIYKGGALKARNQWFNKQRAAYTSAMTKGRPSSHIPDTKMLKALSRRRADFLHDQMHKISSDIVRFLVRSKVSILVIGKNKFQKQNVSMGKRNDQTFMSLPLFTLQRQIRYKAENAGIVVFEQEESYTSKASFADRDDIPVYGKESGTPQFSGKRKGRGLYVSKDGSVFNADINAAANILRKAFPDAVAHIEGAYFLQNVSVVRFYDLNFKRTPVKRIEAA